MSNTHQYTSAHISTHQYTSNTHQYASVPTSAVQYISNTHQYTSARIPYTSVCISKHQYTSVHISAHWCTSVHISTHQNTSVHIITHHRTSAHIRTHQHTAALAPLLLIRTHKSALRRPPRGDFSFISPSLIWASTPPSQAGYPRCLRIRTWLDPDPDSKIEMKPSGNKSAMALGRCI